MNKIFRKCRDFGLMVHLQDIPIDKSVSCVKSLKKGNIPLCVVDVSTNNGFDIIKEITSNEELFVAAQNINNISDAYRAIGVGAQFFLLEKFDTTFMSELTENGFFYIPRVNNNEELKICEDKNLECVILSDKTILNGSTMPYVSYGYDNNALFSIINLPSKEIDWERWINDEYKRFLNLSYTEVRLSKNASDEEKLFGDIFASTHKSKTIINNENSLLLECRDFIKTVNYFKWRGIYINPNSAEYIDDKIVSAPLDSRLNGFLIYLKERNI